MRTFKSLHIQKDLLKKYWEHENMCMYNKRDTVYMLSLCAWLSGQTALLHCRAHHDPPPSSSGLPRICLSRTLPTSLLLVNSFIRHMVSFTACSGSWTQSASLEPNLQVKFCRNAHPAEIMMISSCHGTHTHTHTHRFDTPNWWGLAWFDSASDF